MNLKPTAIGQQWRQKFTLKNVSEHFLFFFPWIVVMNDDGLNRDPFMVITIWFLYRLQWRLIAFSMKKWIPVAASWRKCPKKWNLMKNLFSFFSVKTLSKLFERKIVLMPIPRQNEWTINSRSFYVMRTHHSSNKVDNFTFVDAK